MGGLSPWHWLILIAVAVLLFGAKKLPDAARSLGKSMRIFKSEMRELQAEGSAGKDGETIAPTQPATQVASERVEAPVNPAGQNPTDARPA